MSLVLQDASSSSAGVKVVDVVVGGGVSTAGPASATAAALQWDYSPKSMDGTDGATSNGGTCGDESVISELNGDCSTDDNVCLAQTAIIKQVSVTVDVLLDVVFDSVWLQTDSPP